MSYHRDFSYQTGAPTLFEKESREQQTGKNRFKSDFPTSHTTVITVMIKTQVSHNLLNLSLSKA